MGKLEIAFLKGIIMEPRRVNVINTLQLIASKEQQDEYDQDVPIANIATELVNQWFDDHFHCEEAWFRDLFSDDEWKTLMEFHNYYNAKVNNLPDSYEELREDFNWKQIIGKAQWALAMLGWTDIEAKYDEAR